MRGKFGLVIGLGVGYVLGSRAGRERYEQIKTQALKVWNLDPVQAQVEKVKDIATSSALALPRTVWSAGVGVYKAVSKQQTPGTKLDAGLKAARNSADDVKKAAEADVEKVVGD
ncbi:hypothetical protein [Microbacterium stercoris]|uniref:YtxH domain-containing protein n=1 Tax=Microbacterium stercoris TaxID=2820289 RepID=A0A939QLE4_9MICO|nr:hypothetical protein [Microbacterium stercoris]MBO3665059.1 hypothetical protein [Microbacterium stercoris]